jgi:predicted transcriptional regulator
MSQPYDSRLADKFVVRLPTGIRAEIEGVANALDRSMNSVFVQALRQYLDNQKRQELLLDALAHAVVKKVEQPSATNQ